MKNIAILGSTGSVGTQALEVIRANPELYTVVSLTAQANAGLLIEQALEFKPEMVVIGDESQYAAVKSALSGRQIRVLTGEEALCEAASLAAADFVLTAIMGAVGLRPTIAAIKAKKTIGVFPNPGPNTQLTSQASPHVLQPKGMDSSGQGD